jgi:hypothetical protein
VLRHVVMFKWSPEASETARAEAVSALRAWAAQAATYGHVTVGTDAGLAAANYDVAVVGDFPDEDAYRRYAADPAHLDLLRSHLVPLIDSRAAVQHHT